ncbi:MAG: phosphohistidine phosphatase SixA [Nitrosopumilaceae archaeon]|jgi:phosphohistidine phosphatase
MELYILRHGKAQDHAQTISGDAKRQLTETGKNELECIAKAMKNLQVEVDSIISSPLIRAKQTAEITLKHIKSKKKSISIWNELKPEIDVVKTIKKLTTLKPTSAVLLVGHEPHLTNLIGAIISSDSNSIDITLKKAGLVHIRCNPVKTKISGSLRSLITPKQLKKLCR